MQKNSYRIVVLAGDLFIIKWNTQDVSSCNKLISDLNSSGKTRINNDVASH